MVRREIGARFAGTSLGGLWSLIQPAILLGLYTMVFSAIYRVGEVEGGHGFAEFVFCGLWPWLAFQEACLRSVTAITANANVVKKLQFPSELLVVAVVLASFLVQGVGFLLFLLGLMLWKGTFIGGAGLLLCLPLGLALLLAIGLGMLLACGNVFFRDVEQLATAGFTLWFFLTPDSVSGQPHPGIHRRAVRPEPDGGDYRCLPLDYSVRQPEPGRYVGVRCVLCGRTLLVWPVCLRALPRIFCRLSLNREDTLSCGRSSGFRS